MRLAEHLARMNRWWGAGKIDPAVLPVVPRSELPAFAAALHRVQVLALVGPRRAGKTAMIHGAIAELLDEGCPARRILYIDAEDPVLSSLNPTLSDMFAAYLDEILQEPVHALEAPVYVFIDEAHLLAGWHAEIKALTDYPLPVRWIAVSSSKAALYKGARLLLGRVEHMHAPLLDFQEFCRFWLRRNPQADLSPYLDALPRERAFSDPHGYARGLERALPELSSVKPLVLRALGEYLLAGGYPEYGGSIAWQETWRGAILPDILFHDILAPGGIKNPAALTHALAEIALRSGEAVSFTALAGALGVDTVTAQGYIAHLQRALLIHVQENYMEVSGKVIRKNKKLSIADTGLLRALRRDAAGYDGRDAAEVCVLSGAHAFAERELYGLRYWNDGAREVDLVIDMGGSALPVSVDYGSGITAREASLKTFMSRFNAESALLVTRDELSTEGPVIRVPLWLLR